MKIRAAEPIDASLIAELSLKAFKTSKTKLFSWVYSKEEALNIIENRNSFFLIAFYNNKVAGYIHGKILSPFELAPKNSIHEHLLIQNLCISPKSLKDKLEFPLIQAAKSYGLKTGSRECIFEAIQTYPKSSNLRAVN